jgi:hypothetical protein
MKFANAIRFNRKSGEAEESAVSPSQYRMLMGKSFCSLGAKPRDLQLRGPFLEMVFDRGVMSLAAHPS